MKKYTLMASFLLPSLLLGNASIANISALKGKADIHFKSEIKEAKLNDSLIKQNSISTYDNSKTQIIFKDETIVTVGKNSNFSIEEYLMEDSKEKSVKFNLFEGAIRTITGKIGKLNPSKFKVKTNNAVIGIRGTNFIVITAKGLGDIISCTHGAITVSGTDGKEYFVEQGYMTRVNKQGVIEGVKPFNSDDLNIILNNAFGNNQLENLSIKDLVVFFDYLFDNDPTNDIRKETKKEEKKSAKVTFDNSQSFDIQTNNENKILNETSRELDTSTVTSTNIASNDTTASADIPVENTVALSSDTTQTTVASDSSVSEISQVSSQKIPSLTQTTSSTVYSFGTGNTVTSINNSTLINFYNTQSLILGIDQNTQTISSESLDIDSKTDINFKFNPSLTSYVSPYNFSATFEESSYTSGTKTYTVQQGSYFNTVSDLDENDNVTWGKWSIPIESTDGTSTNSETWSGNFIIGELTPSSVISSYAQSNLKGLYTGELIGQAFEFSNGSSLTTDFSGTSSSNVDFGAGTVDTTLTFSVNGTNYNETLNDTINGNRFGSTNSSGAFYGSDGKTIGGQFNINDSSNARQLVGAFQGKTNTLQ